MIRIGNGFDIHKLVEGRPLILGGVNIPYSKGLLGHSDGDVLTHAVINALLGAAALGDIGTHFPPADPAYKNADSIILLGTVIEEIQALGYRVVNLDSMIVCQQPKLSGHYLTMRESLSSAIGVDKGDVSVKAGTAEGLGAIGQGQAIAVYAVCLLESAP